jgi:hypothetical protein
MDDISRMARPRSPFSQLPGGKSLPLTEGEQMAFSEAATIARFGNIASAAPYKDAGIATFLTKDHSRTAAADVIRSAARNARAVASRYAAAAKSERLKKQVLSQEDKQQESNSINLESLEKQKYEEAKKLDELADACSALFLFRRWDSVDDQPWPIFNSFGAGLTRFTVGVPLLELGWIAQGSLMPQLPGAWRLTRRVKAKTVSIALSEQQVFLYKSAIADHRKLEAILHQNAPD